MILPAVTIMPDSANVPVNAVITLSFSEAVRNTDDSEFLYNTIDNVMILRKTDINGPVVSFDATITSDKRKVTIKPTVLLDSGTVYYVSFLPEIEDYSGNALPVTSVNFKTIGVATSLPEITEMPHVNIFPNPGTGLFTIKTGYSGIIEAEVYSVAGRKVFAGKNLNGPEFYLDLRGNGTGVYFLILKPNGKQIPGSRKLIIN